jgi:hypothetical protein
MLPIPTRVYFQFKFSIAIMKLLIVFCVICVTVIRDQPLSAVDWQEYKV